MTSRHTAPVFSTHRTTYITRMWDNAQHDGRPAEYRSCPLFNAAKFGWRPLVECPTVTLSRRETRWNLLGCPKLANRSQPRKFTILWRQCGEELLFNRFFSIVHTCLSCEDIARQSCAMVLRWRIFGKFLGPAFPASHVQHISNMHSKFALRPHHVWKYGGHPISDGWD